MTVFGMTVFKMAGTIDNMKKPVTGNLGNLKTCI
jgi:hypothetical protein